MKSNNRGVEFHEITEQCSWARTLFSNEEGEEEVQVKEDGCD